VRPAVRLLWRQLYLAAGVVMQSLQQQLLHLAVAAERMTA
jgi:hypothetical protein